MQTEIRKALLHLAEQIFVPLDRNVRIVATLQQELSAIERDRLFDRLRDLLEAERVALARSDGPVERTELATRDAHVRVVDVAVDDVRDDAVRMFLPADVVGHTAELGGGCVEVGVERLLAGQAAGPRPIVTTSEVECR